MRERLAELAARHGLELVGVTSAEPLPDDRARMDESVAAGRMGRMGWMGGIQLCWQAGSCFSCIW